MLRSQCEDLGTSYRAKIERLEFIEAGHELTDRHPAPANCPVCGQAVPEDAQEHFTPTTQAEKRVLVQRLAGLEDTLVGLAKKSSPYWRNGILFGRKPLASLFSLPKSYSHDSSN